MDESWMQQGPEGPLPPVRLQHETLRVSMVASLLDLLWHRAREALPAECAGVLLGRPGEGDVEVVEHWPLESGSASHVHAALPAESWIRAAWDSRQMHPDLEWVGWYHTHPGHGIFLSGPDRELHLTKFHPVACPHATAWVLDPVNETWGVFRALNEGEALVRMTRLMEA
jgi:proteasome lid subunit RPN8/RPN11